MRRRHLAFAASAIAVGFASPPADASLREVAVGNFYFEDSTTGDGRVEAVQGDQLRFTVYDGGPGTPHTVEVDELGIHSGSLASGETYTTPPLSTPGTFVLYCRPHVNRGHRAELVVRASSTGTTTTRPATTSPPTTTTAPTGGGSATTATTTRATATTTAAGAPTGSATTASSASATPDAADPPAAVEPGSTETTLVPVGRGEADAEDLSRPVDPDSLAVALGRPAARRGPWTRSVRLAVLALVAMVAAAVLAAVRGRRLSASEVGAPAASPPPDPPA